MKQRSPYETILVLVLAGVVVYFISADKHILWITLCLGGISLFFPSFARLVHRGWYKLSEMLGFVTGKILLTVVYILFVLPFSFLFRKKVSINLKRKDGSYFKIRDHQFEKKDLENTW